MLLNKRENRDEKYIIRTWQRMWVHLKLKRYVTPQKGITCFYSRENCDFIGYLPSQSIYRIVKLYFPEYLSPVVSEVLHQLKPGGMFRGYANIFRFIIFDEERQNQYHRVERNAIFCIFLRHVERQRHKGYRSCDIEMKIYEDMMSLNVSYVMDMLSIIRANWEEYFDRVVLPVVKGFQNLFKPKLFSERDKTTWSLVYSRLPDTRDLNIEAVSFLIYDALYYLQNGFSSAYNPYWIFGSEHYEEIMQRIWNCKNEDAKIKETW